MLHESDIEVMRKALEKAKLDSPYCNSLLPLNAIDYGKAFYDYSKKSNIPLENIKVC